MTKTANASKASTDVAVKDANTEIATLEQEMAAAAEAMAAGLQVSSDKISTQNKAYKLPDGTILGPVMEAVVLGFTHSHSYYDNEQYDPQNIQEPSCYSDTIGNADKVPAASIEKPFSPNCDSCPNNQFGSASNGKGKRCKEEMRVALVPKGTEGVVTLNIPPTGIKAFSKTINSIIKANGLPVKAMCRFEFNPSVQFSQPIITDATDNPDYAKHFALSKDVMADIVRK